MVILWTIRIERRRCLVVFWCEECEWKAKLAAVHPIGKFLRDFEKCQRLRERERERERESRGEREYRAS
jgi:hypothetical protein